MQLVHRPLQFTLALAALALLLLYALSRTSWRPVAPLRLARRRAWGQTLAAAARMYLAKPGLMLGIGVLFIPISLLTALLQALVVHGTDILGVETGSRAGGLLGFFVLAIGTALTLLGLGLAQAATARALVEVDQGRPVGPLRAYVLAADSIRPLLGALVIAATVVSLLVGSIYLIPIAVWLAGRWALIAPSIELEQLGALAGLRRSRLLVRGAWLKVASLIVVGAALAIAVGPVVGALLILATSAPFWLVNVIAGLIYAVTMPLVAITTAYVYFDRRVADELAEPMRSSELPAEIELWAGRAVKRTEAPPSVERTFNGSSRSRTLSSATSRSRTATRGSQRPPPPDRHRRELVHVRDLGVAAGGRHDPRRGPVAYLERRLGEGRWLLHPVATLWRKLLRRGLFDRETRLGRLTAAAPHAVRRLRAGKRRRRPRQPEGVRGDRARVRAVSRDPPATARPHFSTAAAGDPPEGQRLLRQAFAHYEQAGSRAIRSRHAELALLANLEIGLHEQTRLQPEIREALDAASATQEDLGTPRARRALAFRVALVGDGYEAGRGRRSASRSRAIQRASSKLAREVITER